MIRGDDINRLWRTIVEDRRILRGDDVGPSDVTAQDVMGTMAVNLRALATKLDGIRTGERVEAFLVLFSEDVEGD